MISNSISTVHIDSDRMIGCAGKALAKILMITVSPLSPVPVLLIFLFFQSYLCNVLWSWSSHCNVVSNSSVLVFLSNSVLMCVGNFNISLDEFCKFLGSWQRFQLDNCKST